jgi:hypothetical protein
MITQIKLSLAASLFLLIAFQHTRAKHMFTSIMAIPGSQTQISKQNPMNIIALGIDLDAAE